MPLKGRPRRHRPPGARWWHALGRIRVRLLVVNCVVVLVPVAGLEFARLFERSLLDALEQDMRNQAVLTRRMLERDLGRGVPIGDESQQQLLTRAASDTRMRVRVLGPGGDVRADSHAEGPPEGPEPPAPSLWPRSVSRRARAVSSDVRARAMRSYTGPTWPPVAERREVTKALQGRRAAYTRIRRSPPSVLLFVSEPIMREGAVEGAVYVTRSTRPVLAQLYRIRAGLYKVLAVTLVVTLLVTLVLSWSISRPLGKLSRAAKRIAAGDRDVQVPVGGGGEIRELGEAFGAMTRELAARMRYISDFAADVAHEFKSPLTSIRGAAELLEEGAADDPEARRRFLHNIELDADRLDRLVSQLMQLGRIEGSSEAMAVLDLEAVLRRAAHRAEGPDNPVSVRWNAPVRMVRGREGELETAFVNVLDNAVRVSPPGAAVEVDATVRGRALAVSIHDRGPGIPDAHRARIFDRFFTTEAEQGGTGLGLAITRVVVQAHGGRIEVGNAKGGGATFIVALPVHRT